MEIKVGKLYKTRNGNKVVVYAVDVPNTVYPIHGFIAYTSGPSPGPNSWTKTGQFDLHKETSDSDIVAEWEEPKPRRIAYVSDNGVIRLIVPEDGAELLRQYPDYRRAPWLDEPEGR
jgi:hypothetical protein